MVFFFLLLWCKFIVRYIKIFLGVLLAFEIYTLRKYQILRHPDYFFHIWRWNIVVQRSFIMLYLSNPRCVCAFNIQYRPLIVVRGNLVASLFLCEERERKEDSLIHQIWNVYSLYEDSSGTRIWRIFQSYVFCIRILRLLRQALHTTILLYLKTWTEQNVQKIFDSYCRTCAMHIFSLSLFSLKMR